MGKYVGRKHVSIPRVSFKRNIFLQRSSGVCNLLGMIKDNLAFVECRLICGPACVHVQISFTPGIRSAVEFFRRVAAEPNRMRQKNRAAEEQRHEPAFCSPFG